MLSLSKPTKRTMAATHLVLRPTRSGNCNQLLSQTGIRCFSSSEALATHKASSMGGCIETPTRSTNTRDPQINQHEMATIHTQAPAASARPIQQQPQLVSGSPVKSQPPPPQKTAISREQTPPLLQTEPEDAPLPHISDREGFNL